MGIGSIRRPRPRPATPAPPGRDSSPDRGGGARPPLDAWIRATARALRDVVAGLVDVPSCRAGDVLRSAAGQEQVVAGDVFACTRPGLLAQTVHELKGQES